MSTLYELAEAARRATPEELEAFARMPLGDMVRHLDELQPVADFPALRIEPGLCA